MSINLLLEKEYIEIEEKYFLYKDCEELHPITFEWAKIFDVESNDKISIFENIKEVLTPSFYDKYLGSSDEGLKLNPKFKELFDAIESDDIDNIIDAQELEEAVTDITIKRLTSKYIVKHASEWNYEKDKWGSIEEILEKEEDKKHFENENKRIEKLQFFDDCKGIPDFPQSDLVYHINPIGLVGEFKTSKKGCLSMDKFKLIFPSAPEEKRKEVLKVFNEYCHAFEINTILRVAHFFAQIKEEVGEQINYKNESLNYSAKRLKSKVSLIDDDGRRKSKGPFSYFWSHHADADLYGSIRATGQVANQKEIANRAYANRNGNGNISSDDGWNFRGKGFIQLTGRTNYENANNQIQQYAPNSNINIITDPASILTMKGAMLSSMGFWVENNLNVISDNAKWSSANNITNVVNSATDSRAHRNTNLAKIKIILE